MEKNKQSIENLKRMGNFPRIYKLVYIKNLENEEFYIHELSKFNKNIYEKNKHKISLIKCLFYQNILVIDDVIDDEFCEELIELMDTAIENDEYKIEKWGNSQNVQCKFISLSNNEYKNSKYLDDKMHKIMNKYINIIYFFYKAIMKLSINVSFDDGYTLRKIHGKTRQHSDGVFNNSKDKKGIRSMSLILSLSDFDGGKIVFPNQRFAYKLTKRKMICFPPYWTYPHFVEEPLNNTFRYTINTWILEK